MRKIFLTALLITFKAQIGGASVPIEAPRYVAGMLPAAHDMGSLSVQCRPSVSKSQLQCHFSKLSIVVPDRKKSADEAQSELLELQKMNKVDSYVKSLCAASLAENTSGEDPESKAAVTFQQRRAALCRCPTKDCKEAKLVDFLKAQNLACRIQVNQFQVALTGVAPETWEYHSTDPGPCGLKVDTILKIQGGLATSFSESTLRLKEGPNCEMFPKSTTLIYDQKSLGRYTNPCSEMTIRN